MSLTVYQGLRESYEIYIIYRVTGDICHRLRVNKTNIMIFAVNFAFVLFLFLFFTFFYLAVTQFHCNFYLESVRTFF